jgi:hypothetical protein
MFHNINMTKKPKHVSGGHKSKNSRHIEHESSGSEYCSNSSHESSGSYYSSSSEDCYASDDSQLSGDGSLSSIVSSLACEKKKSSNYYKTKAARKKRGILRISKKGAVIKFTEMTKIILKKWDTGGYIEDSFLATLVETFKDVLKKKIDMALSDSVADSECMCCIKDALYIVAVAFVMHYNASSGEPEKWKVKFQGVVKYLLHHKLIPLEVVYGVIPLDDDGNFYKDENGIILLTPVPNEDLDPETGESYLITSPKYWIEGTYLPEILLDPPKNPPRRYNLKDIALITLTEKQLSGFMTSVSNRMLAFVDTNVYNDD